MVRRHQDRRTGIAPDRRDMPQDERLDRPGERPGPGPGGGSAQGTDPATAPAGDGSEMAGRGRAAWRPPGISRAGWRDIVLRVTARIGRDYVSLMAAGVAFFGLLSLFPALATLASLAGILFEPGIVERQIAGLGGVAPSQPVEVIRDQAARLAERQTGTLGLTALISLAISFFFGSRGVDNLIDGINMAYAEHETRNIVLRNVVSLGLTAVLMVLTLLALGLTVVVPALAEAIGLGDRTDLIVRWGRWPLIALLVLAGLGLLYRYGPARRPPRWSWVSPGAVGATVFWLGGSLLFSFLVRNFGSYEPTFGAIAGVVILLLWMWLSSFVVLVGAQLNAEMEHQTRRDTTRGRVRPMGERGAYMADTLGRKP
jgi:membrane protein